MKRGSILASPLFVVITAMFLIGVSASAGAQIRAISQEIDVVVQEGDNLTAIVKSVMGAGEFWQEVADTNNIEQPNRLKPGQVIRFSGQLVQKRNFAKVAFAKGNANLQRLGADGKSSLLKGAKIYLGDVIETGEDGFVSLSFLGESFVNVQPDSRIQIRQFDCFDSDKPCVVNLFTDKGQMDFDIRNVGFKKPPLYSIETPYASAAVRGTRFDVDVLDGGVIGVTEGAVQVSAGDLTASLPLGKGTLAGEGKSITTLYDLLEKPVYNAFIRLTHEDYLSWAPVDDASIYKYVLAENQSLSDVIFSGRTTDTYLKMLPESPQFFLSTRAIDKNGIKGFRALQRVDQVLIDDSVEAPALEIELSENQLKIVNPASHTAEIHIGNELEPAGDIDQLLTFKAIDLGAGETTELVVDASQDIYISTRAVVSNSAVSAYGHIYEFKRNSQ